MDWQDFWDLVLRTILNLMVVLYLVRYMYYKTTPRKDYLFTYILISSVVFLLCFLLDNVKLQLGFALGLFAIFGIIRYRSPSIDLKEMTYLFLVIGVSIINALVEFSMQTLMGLIIANLIVIDIVCRSNLQASCSKFHVDIIIGNDWNLASN